MSLNDLGVPCSPKHGMTLLKWEEFVRLSPGEESQAGCCVPAGTESLSVVWELLYHLMPGLGGLLFNSSTEEPSVHYVPIQGVMGMGVFVGKLLFKAFWKEQQGLSRMGMSLVLLEWLNLSVLLDGIEMNLIQHNFVWFRCLMQGDLSSVIAF